MNHRFINKTIKQLAKEKGITYTEHSDGWVIELSKNGRSEYIVGYTFGLNSASASLIMKDKVAASDVLRTHGIPSIEYLLVQPPSMKSYIQDVDQDARIDSFIQENEYPIVCKPAKGVAGRKIHLASNRTELDHALNDVLVGYDAACLSAYKHIDHEYRSVVLGNRIVLMYDKIPPKDGKGMVQHNLGHGATPKIVDSADYPEIVKIVRDTAAVLGTGFYVIDVIDVQGKQEVLELNGGVMFESFSSFSRENKQIGMDIYGQALDLLFESD